MTNCVHSAPRLPVSSSHTVPLGIGLRILSGLLFVGMSCCVKGLSDHVPVGQIVFFRSFVALAPLIAFLVWCREWPRGLATRRPLGHLARCVLGCLAMFASFATLGFLPVAEATLLNYLSPLFVVILAGPLLRERVGAARWLGVLIGLSGVACLAVPEMGATVDAPDRLIGLGLGVLTGVLTAGAMLQLRRLAQSESAGAIAFYFAVLCSLAGLATWPAGWVMPTATEMGLLVAAGLLGGSAHIAMTLSFRYAEASVLAPFEYTTILWAVLSDLLLSGLLPDPIFAASAAMVITGAVVVARNEIFGARRGRPAPPSPHQQPPDDA